MSRSKRVPRDCGTGVKQGTTNSILAVHRLLLTLRTIHFRLAQFKVLDSERAGMIPHAHWYSRWYREVVQFSELQFLYTYKSTRYKRIGGVVQPPPASTNTDVNSHIMPLNRGIFVLDTIFIIEDTSRRPEQQQETAVLVQTIHTQHNGSLIQSLWG